jgi:hypothetical protein
VVFLADLDQEPASRWRGLLLGVAIALPVTLVFGSWLLPRLRAAIVNAATDHDAHARERGEYMDGLCNSALVVSRDERLCGCVLGTEYPGMDCMDRFNEWLTDRQAERCEEQATFEASISFCTCVQTLVEANATPRVNSTDSTSKAQGFPRCMGLEDRLDYPALDKLAPAFAEDAG